MENPNKIGKFQSNNVDLTFKNVCNHHINRILKTKYDELEDEQHLHPFMIYTPTKIGTELNFLKRPSIKNLQLIPQVMLKCWLLSPSYQEQNNLFSSLLFNIVLEKPASVFFFFFFEAKQSKMDFIQS